MKEAGRAHEYGDHKGSQDHGNVNHKENTGWDLSANDAQKQEEAGQDPGNNNEHEESWTGYGRHKEETRKDENNNHYKHDISRNHEEERDL